MNQTERLRRYLEQHKVIDPMAAWEQLGIYRLGARIFDLKKMGMNITKRTKTVQNRFGESCHVAQYILGAEQ